MLFHRTLGLIVFFAMSAFSAIGATAQEPGRLVGHTGVVYSVDVSRDGKWIVTGSFDKSVRLWDAKTLKPVVTADGHTGLILSVAFSHDGKRFASGSYDKTVRIWSVDILTAKPKPEEKKKPDDKNKKKPDAKKPDAKKQDAKKPTKPENKSFAELKGHTELVNSVAFSPDGKLLASASSDKSVRLWDTATNKQVKALSAQGGAVYSVAFSPDGKTLLTGSADKTVRLFDVAGGKELRKFNGPGYAVYSVTYSPDGKTIAAAGQGLGNDRAIYVWDVEKPEPVKIITGHTADVYRVQFNAKGSRLMTVGYSGAVRIWDPQTGTNLHSVKLPPSAYYGCYTADGTKLLIANQDKVAYLVPVPEAAR